MIIASTHSKEKELQEELEILEKRGVLHFGIHTIKQALITCIIYDYAHNHVHFIDGADVGYALAQKKYKLNRT